VGLDDQEGKPELRIRFTRPIQANPRFDSVEEMSASLDWWARWRMNVTAYPGPRWPTFIEESHQRGLRVLCALGVRKLCAADDRAVADKVAEFERFLELGGDGAVALWDDLPRERCKGHCDACRKRFGENSLPREIVHVLESLAAVAARQAAPPLIVWCPPHYSSRRYRDMPDEVFFREVGNSAAVRRWTHMLYCEVLPEAAGLLDRNGLTQRVWWYNGMRSVYHCRLWARAQDIDRDLKFPHNGFPRFESGWKMGVDIDANGGLVEATVANRQALQTLPKRYDGYYPCTALRPYHAAVGAVFAWSPHSFSQPEADRLVFRAMFGPQSATTAREWSDLYDELQVWIARHAGKNSSDSEFEHAKGLFERWRGRRRVLEDLAARGQSLLAPPALAAALREMQEAEQTIGTMLSEKPATTAPERPPRP